MGGHANPKTQREESGGVCGEGERKRVRDRERERESAHTRERERVSKRFGSSFYMFFSSTLACPMQIGLSRSAVCSA